MLRKWNVLIKINFLIHILEENKKKYAIYLEEKNPYFVGLRKYFLNKAHGIIHERNTGKFDFTKLKTHINKRHQNKVKRKVRETS